MADDSSVVGLAQVAAYVSSAMWKSKQATITNERVDRFMTP
jgi:mono/diheme cytochrome c family protein